MSTLPTLFETFLSKIRPQDKHKDDYKKGHEILRDHLQDDNDIEEFYVADLLQGSYCRWTALKPQKDEKSDVDITLVTELSSDIDADVALEMCEPFLDKHYEGQWSPNAHSYKIEEDEVEIDLVLTAAPSEATREVVNSLNSLDVGAALSEDESKDSLSTVARALNITAEVMMNGGTNRSRFRIGMKTSGRILTLLRLSPLLWKKTTSQMATT